MMVGYAVCTTPSVSKIRNVILIRESRIWITSKVGIEFLPEPKTAYIITCATI